MLFLLLICRISYVLSNDLNNSERDFNKIDSDNYPFYHTIVLNDVAEVMNEIDNDMVSPFEEILSNSGSDENIDDLLYEYNHYLTKAHNQRNKYLEKYKLKNKMPLMGQELYKKQKKYNDLTDNIFNTRQFQHGYSIPNNIMDIFIPIKSISRNYNNKIETSTTDPDGFFKGKTIEKTRRYDKEYCNCQNSLSPCDCNNNQFRNYYDTYNYKKADSVDKVIKSYSKLLPTLTDNMYGETLNAVKYRKNDDLLNNIMNIKLKIDIQVPKYQESFPELCTNCAMQKYPEEIDLSPPILNMPFPYYPAMSFGNYGSTNMFKVKSDGYNPMHKFMIHKKKKSRSSSGNKKHRKKSAVSLQSFNIYDDKDNVEFVKKLDDVKDVGPSNITEKPSSIMDEVTNVTSTDRQELRLTVNVTFNAENQTDNLSVNNVDETTEPDNSKTTVDDVTIKPREKRDIVLIKNNTANNVTKDHKSNMENTKVKKSIDKNKNIISDDEMLYWPELTIDTTITDITKFNITKEVESKVPSSNIMTKITHDNETSLINVVSDKFDWSDMEKVVPVFISFFGKYFNGIMTFCTDTVCHSVKCSDKTCTHRYCSHENRLNYKGHCHKSNTADSVVALGHTMDLTPKILYEVVDKLEDKAKGKLFGKGSFCLNSKCITFAVSKKTFVKTKCNNKVLSEAGHCSLIKT